MREMAELDEPGGFGVPREGGLTGGLDLGEIVLGRAVLKGRLVVLCYGVTFSKLLLSATVSSNVERGK